MKEPLRVIQGDWVASPDWLNLPHLIRARSPEDRNKTVRVRVHREDVLKAAVNRRRQPAYDFWAVLNGKIPPVPHMREDDADGLMSLYDAHACFQGVRRPIADDDDGDGFTAYVLKPRYFFVYEPRPPLVLTLKREVPDDLVFVAYVRLDVPPETGGVRGVLTHWHFVEAEAGDGRLPIEYEDRYVRRLW